MANYNLNSYLFTLINNFAGTNKILDSFMIFIAKYFIFIIPIFLIYLWFKNGRDNENKNLALLIFITILISLLFGWIINLFYFHPRPFMIGLGKLLISHASDSSFPSDHAIIMFSVAFTLIFFKKYKFGAVFFVLGLLVGFARIFVGVHFPFDILGSLIIAIITSFVIFCARYKLTRINEKILNKYLKF